MNLYLIRHAQQASMLCNVDVALSAAGRRQAELAAERLAGYPLEALYSSTMLRAKQTAEIIGRRIGLENQITEGIEEIHFGAWEGKTDAEIAECYGELKARMAQMTEDLPYPDGENGAQCAARAMAVLREIARRSGEADAAVVTHGGLIRCVLADIFGGTYCYPRRYQFAVQLENTSITQLRYTPETDRFTLERLNDYAHLEGKEELLRKNRAKYAR